MRLTPSDRDTYRIITTIIIVLVIAISIGFAMLLGHQASEEIRQRLSERSQSIAAALGPEEVTQLAGQASDGDTQVYKNLKAKLAAAAAPDQAIRSIYLAGQHAGRLFFYVDSEDPNSRDYSSAAEWYDDATPEFKAMFHNGKPVVEGPVTDEYGTFISGLAPIFKPEGNQVVAVLGIDVGAATYWRDIALAASIPMLAGLSIILVIVVFEWIRRRNAQLMSLKSELVSVASHELRSPIIGIRWAAESIERLNQQEDLRRLIRAILGSAQNLQASTDDILELSHAMNRRGLNVVPTDMLKLLQDVLTTQSLSAEQKGVTLTMDTSWPTTLVITCDADKMKRVLHNIISNAIKYTRPSTPVTISYQQGDGMHKIVVRDEGIGIPRAEQDKVFKGFYRASNAVANDIPGTGLGLYLVKAVLEQHHGSVTFTSDEGQGTTFTLSLPIRK
jgi:signal transduction histidine kinase